MFELSPRTAMLKKKSQLSTLCGAGLFFSNTEMQQRVYHVIKRHLLKRVVWVCLGYSTKSSPGIADAYVQEVWPLKCGSSFAVLSIYCKGMQRTSCKIGKRIQRHLHVIQSFLYLGVKDIMLEIPAGTGGDEGSDT